MVDAISSSAVSLLTASSSTSSTTTSSTSGSGTSEIEAQIAAKQNELASATDDAARTELQEAIAELKAELAKAQAAEKSQKQSPSALTETTSSAQLSGESEKIGTTNFDDDTPFGDREAWV
jgi:DNA repair exonuclease SbcCD ATPase subunit